MAPGRTTGQENVIGSRRVDIAALPRFGRICDPAETVRRVRPHMAALGITRLARQTGLDRIGIPVWAAIRPNSLSLAVNQGKGANDDAAMASALMEAAEYAIAERPNAPARIATKAELLAEGAPVFEPRRQMAPGALVPENRELSWLSGRSLFHGGEVWVPTEAVRLDHTTEVFGGLARSSNGLASGNNEDEAVLHALCELVERDAQTFQRFRPGRSASLVRIDPASFGSALVDDLCARLRAADFHLDLFDITTEIGIPVVHAVVRDARIPVHGQLDLAAGSGCHPFVPHAAVRAITEAVQTRITNISGARDDIDPAEYAEPLRPGLRAYVEAAHTQATGEPPRSIASPEVTPARFLDIVRQRLLDAGIDEAIAVTLGSEAHEIVVVRAFAPRLEDRPVNRFWTPGPRMAKAMLRLW
ncbi:YcaO-like family protein [Aureimonas sp. ME7]|uniref:YcaO-like family protein n=1 Tax=Aureimonas sp. ME7 TaxID=2744252 RepID=UPI0015F5F47A|nr:YcaO-like family protein [Aureimonas sp. ME7]